MTDTLKLKALLVLNGYTQKDIAKILGISSQSVFKKIHNKSEFKASEINKLCGCLKIDNKQAVFFAQCVDFNSTRC